MSYTNVNHVKGNGNQYLLKSYNIAKHIYNSKSNFNFANDFCNENQKSSANRNVY